MDDRTKRLIYSILCIVADTLDSVISLVIPETTSNGIPKAEESDIDDLPDEQLRELLMDCPELESNGEPVALHPSPGTVAKSTYDMGSPGGRDNECAEASAQHTVLLRTNIPVPRVRRVIHMRLIHRVIFMDYIPGKTLAEVWPTYSLWRKIRVAVILRRYIRQLQRTTAPPGTPPGPISERSPLVCYVPTVFGQVRSTRGPFASYKDMSKFMNERYSLYFRDRPEKLEGKDEKFDDSEPLVLTHNDLNPRNIIAGDDGRLWVVDWAWAGYYPRWFEYCAMTEQITNEESAGWPDRFWELMVPFVCGPYFGQYRWLGRAQYGLYFK